MRRFLILEPGPIIISFVGDDFILFFIVKIENHVSRSFIIAFNSKWNEISGVGSFSFLNKREKLCYVIYLAAWFPYFRTGEGGVTSMHILFYSEILRCQNQ